MNVCIICQADGVVSAAGHWYCMDHLADGLRASGAAVLTLSTGRHDSEFIQRKLDELDRWLAED